MTTDQTSVHSFLGTYNQLAFFVPDFQHHTVSLRQLTSLLLLSKRIGDAVANSERACLVKSCLLSDSDCSCCLFSFASFSDLFKPGRLFSLENDIYVATVQTKHVLRAHLCLQINCHLNRVSVLGGFYTPVFAGIQVALTSLISLVQKLISLFVFWPSAVRVVIFFAQTKPAGRSSDLFF